MTKKQLSTAGKITEALKTTLPDHTVHAVVKEVGEVVYIGDGVCKIRGLPSVKIEEVVIIETPVAEIPSLVLGLNEDVVEAVVLGDYTSIRQGQTARATGEGMKIPVGESLLGRVITPLGEPLDGLGPVTSRTFGDVERLAPGVAKREPVVDQFNSGVLVVDTLIPLGQGQRELVIGDRKSGKTRLMQNFIMNQKGKDIFCVYVAIGAQKAKIRGIEQALRESGAMDYTTIVLGSSDDQPSLNYIAPYVGTAVAEYFRDNGKNAIIIYDDLSRHAKAYRQMSLLLKRSPGRDAYPGDIFYLHSRLLERSCKMHKKLGGGSLTGFPMAETLNGDNSEYIVTNLMSITDGHIFLDVNLMHEGILPAVNSGASVSRIGGGVQPPGLRKMGELAGSQIARYNEVKSFETLNTEINEETEREIKRGKRLLASFGQQSSMTLSNDEIMIIMHLVTSGKTDDVEVADLKIIVQEIIPFYRSRNYDEYKKAAVKGKAEELDPFIQQIAKDYIPTSTAETAKYIFEKKGAEVVGTPIVPAPPEEGAKDTKPEEKKEEKPAEEPKKA